MNRFSGSKPRVVILGGGFGGAFAALELMKRGRDEVEVVLLDRNNYLTFYPLMVEAGVGAVEPRHVVVPLRSFLKGRFLMAEVTDLDLAGRTVGYRIVGEEHESRLGYDHLIFSLGSITNLPPVPGLREYGFEMKAMPDAVELRDRGIRLMEQANVERDPAVKRELLTFLVVGGNYTGVEVAGEFHAFLQEAAEKQYENVDADDVRVMLFERNAHVLPALRSDLALWAEGKMKERGIEIRHDVTVKEVASDHALLTDGTIVPTRSVYWTAGIKPSPVLQNAPGMPLNEKGYIRTGADLRVEGWDNVWAIGDAATVFAPEGKPYPATAQHASRMGPVCAQNLLAVLRGGKTKPFVFKSLGSFAAIGRRQAVAEMGKIPLKGFPAWLAYRGAYLVKIPTFAMKLRLLGDWVLEFFLKAPIVQMGFHRSARVTKNLAPAPEAPKAESESVVVGR